MKNPFIGNHLFVDNSMLELITTCPRSAYYNIIKGRELDSERPPLRFGGAIHSALAYRYNLEARGLPWTEDGQINELSKAFESQPCENEGWRSFNNAVKVICSFNRSPFNKNDFTIKRNPKDNEPLVEKSFAVMLKDKIRGFSISYCGRIDLVVETQDGLYVDDFKTTSILGQTFWDTMATEPAQRGYCWAMRECTGIEPIGYRITALAIRPSIEDATYCKETGEVLPPPKSTAKPVEFARQRFFTKIPEGQLDEWYNNLLSQLDVFLYYYQKPGNNSHNHSSLHFPMHKKWCVGKYGLCQYYHVCSLPESQREMALQSNAFKDVEWSPLEQGK